MREHLNKKVKKDGVMEKVANKNVVEIEEGVILSPEELTTRGTYDLKKKKFVDMVATDGVEYYTCNSKDPQKTKQCGNTLPITKFHKDGKNHKNQCINCTNEQVAKTRKIRTARERYGAAVDLVKFVNENGLAE